MDKKKKFGIIAGTAGAVGVTLAALIYKAVFSKKAKSTEQAEENTQE